MFLYTCVLAVKSARLLYGSCDPADSGNVEDDVAEILDLVDSEETPDSETPETAAGAGDLEEREVVILRDVDAEVADEVIRVIGSMSELEAQHQGGT